MLKPSQPNMLIAKRAPSGAIASINRKINLGLGAFLLKMASNRLALYEKILAFLEDGVSPFDAIDRIATRMEKSKDARGDVLREWQRRLRSGSDIASALKGFVPDVDRAMIGSGETSGRLVDALRETVAMTESTVNLARAVRGAVVPSLIQIVLLFAVIAVVALFIAPELRKVAPPSMWPPVTAFYFGMNDFIIAWGGWFVLGLVAFLAVAFWSFPRWTGSYRLMADRLPFMPWRLYRDVISAFFLIILSSMMRAGVQIDDALVRIASFSSAYMRFHVDRMRLMLRRGRSEGEALNSGLFNPSMAGDIEDFAGLSGFAKAIDRLGRRSERNTRDMIEGRAKLLSTFVLIGIFAFVGLTFAAVSSLIMAFFEKNVMM